MSVRRAVARPVDMRDLGAIVARYEESSLPEATKVALRFVDAFLADPGGLSADGRRQMVDHFSSLQIVELALRCVHHSTNKPSIALGFDAAADESGLSTFHY